MPNGKNILQSRIFDIKHGLDYHGRPLKKGRIGITKRVEHVNKETSGVLYRMIWNAETKELRKEKVD